MRMLSSAFSALTQALRCVFGQSFLYAVLSTYWRIPLG